MAIFSPMPYWHTVWHKICCWLPFWQAARASCHFGSLSAILAFGTGFASTINPHPWGDRSWPFRSEPFATLSRSERNRQLHRFDCLCGNRNHHRNRRDGRKNCRNETFSSFTLFLFPDYTLRGIIVKQKKSVAPLGDGNHDSSMIRQSVALS